VQAKASGGGGARLQVESVVILLAEEDRVQTEASDQS
jgi:hypothetical protein